MLDQPWAIAIKCIGLALGFTSLIFLFLVLRCFIKGKINEGSWKKCNLGMMNCYCCSATCFIYLGCAFLNLSEMRAGEPWLHMFLMPLWALNPLIIFWILNIMVRRGQKRESQQEAQAQESSQDQA